MPNRIDAVMEKVKAGTGLVAVQDGNFREYARRFVEAGPPRPVLLWESDGFRWFTEETDDLPDAPHLPDALGFAKDYRGACVFLFNCAGVDLDAQADRVRRRLKELGDRLSLHPDRTAILVLDRVIPAALVGAAAYVGEAPKKPDGVAAPKRPTGVAAELAGVADAAEFDTDAWRERIERLTPEEMDDVVKDKAYRGAYDRLLALRDRLKKRFVHKDRVIDAAVAAAVAQVPVVLIGPPGTAKGNIIRALCEGLGLGAAGDAGKRYFEYLLTRYTTPEEVFGPVHIQELIDRQTHRRVTVGHLPEAHVAFLDEIFKASSAILNTLLSILNERVFYNAGRPQPVPLTVVFAASNEVPGDPSLAALYDRFPIRIDCSAVEDDQLPHLLRLAWEQANDRVFAGGAGPAERLACTNDLRLLHRVLHTRFGGRKTAERARDAVGGDFAAEFVRAARALRVECGISDRSIGLLYAFARAQALLAGKDRLTVDELDVFRYVRWDETGEHDRMVTNLKRSYRA